MSQPDTGRGNSHGWSGRAPGPRLPELIDVDTAAEAEQIAADTPGSAFATCLTGLRYGATQAEAVADEGISAGWDHASSREWLNSFWLHEVRVRVTALAKFCRGRMPSRTPGPPGQSTWAVVAATRGTRPWFPKSSQ